MKTFYAKDFGVLPGKDAAEGLAAVFDRMAEEDGEKELIFDRGTYFVNAEALRTEKLYITNTVGDNEWKSGEEPHLNRAGMRLKGVRDLTVEGRGAVFVLLGQACNAVLTDCERVTIRDVVFDSDNPDMHELRVVGKGLFHIDFEADGNSAVEKRGNKCFFVGKDYAVPVTEGRPAGWIGKISVGEENSVKRVNHPLTGALSVRLVGKRTLRAYYPLAPQYRIGDVFCLFDVRRKYNGIVADNCFGVTLDGVTQRFNYGLALVCQRSGDIVVENCVFAPDGASGRHMASVADFVQICMCRGKVSILNNVFEGSGDDCLNVHGIHFGIRAADGNRAELVFGHRQTHGFDPFREGDKLRIIDKDTLLPCAEAVVKGSSLADENTLILTLDRPADGFVGKAAENASACPDVDFVGNTLDRVITRGVLVTTSGKVRIERNDFRHTSMHAVLISDDARSWYESGFVRDVGIRGNRFGACRGYTLIVKPENRRYGGAVHRNVTFEDNTIDSRGQGGFYFKDCEDVSVTNNRIKGSVKKTKTLRCDPQFRNNTEVKE